MPEGDTLRRLATRIDTTFAGERVQRSEMRDPRLVGLDLTGRVLVGADAYGKYLFVRFDDGRTVYAHLLMTGSFEVGRQSREPTWKRRIELWLGSGRLTGLDVPVLGVVATAEEHTVVDGLGPDLCAPAAPPDPEVVAARLCRAPDEALTGALLDQHLVAGFGNIYVNEVPFIAGVNPSQPIGSIDGLSELVAVGIALIRTNSDRGPQNTTGRRLSTDARWVHGAGRRPCQICGERLEYRSAHQSAWGRSITWCPGCQPLEPRRRVDLGRIRRLLALHPAAKQPYFP